MQQFIAISIFPEIFKALKFGITGQAMKKNLYELTLINPRNYAENPRGYVDDRPFGGGPGMIMTAPVIDRCIEASKKTLQSKPAVVNLSPHGYPVNNEILDELISIGSTIFICGRYEGIDQRVIDEHATHHICLADIVLTGGEIAALACMDAIIRQLPEALNNPKSVTQESFKTNILDHPHYTKPKNYKNFSVPPVLLSGNHDKIRNWRKLEAIKLTKKFRAQTNKIRDDYE